MGGDEDDDDDDEDGEGGPARKKRGGHGRRKIEIEYIEDKIRRHITFSKRKAGISKKAYELSRLTGAQVRETPGLAISHPTPPPRWPSPRFGAPSGRTAAHATRFPHFGNLITLSPFADALALSLCVCPSAGPPSDLIRARADLPFATPKLQPILVNENSKQLIEQCLNAPDPMALPPAPMPMEPPPQMPPQAAAAGAADAAAAAGDAARDARTLSPAHQAFPAAFLSVPLPHLALFCALLFS